MRAESWNSIRMINTHVFFVYGNFLLQLKFILENSTSCSNKQYITCFKIINKLIFLGPCGIPEVPPATNRTYVFSIIYIVISALWIPVSILLLGK